MRKEADKRRSRGDVGADYLMDDGVEVDPEKLTEGADNQLNALDLKVQCQRLFTRFFEGVADFPPELALCIQHMRDAVTYQFGVTPSLFTLPE